ncbi:MAG: gluconokinase [Pyrinomonadaceae bacterium]
MGSSTYTSVVHNGPHILSVDIGSSGTRAAIYDGHGREVAGTAASMPRTFGHTPDGGAEIDADELVAQTEAVITQSLSAAGTNSIEAVAIASFWHSLVGVDAAGTAITPIYGWADTRARRAAEQLRQKFDPAKTHLRTGCRLHAGYWPAKIRSLRVAFPEMFGRVKRWASPGDLLIERWCGQSATSVSMASGTGLLDQRRCEWDDELLAGIGLDRSAMPALADDALIFHLRSEYVQRWPQLARARIFPALGDGAANNIGAGCVTRERAALMIGTSGAMRVLWTGPPPDELPPGLWQYRADRERVVVGGALSDGGGLYRWLRDSLALTGDSAELERALSKLEPDTHGLTVLPFWAGERSTGWNDAARGGVFGATMQTQPIEILRAALEAVAYRFAAIADQLGRVAEPVTIYASGGALRESAVWTQILADVLGQPLQLTNVAEASSRGAALLALSRVGAEPILELFTPTVTGAVEPDLRSHARYQEARERQQQLRDTLYGQES